jgi:hypothetical protein
MSTTSFVAIMAFIFIAVVASIPLFENFKKYSRVKKFLVGFSVIFLFLFGIVDIYYKTSDPIEIDRIFKILDRIANAIGGKNKNIQKPIPQAISHYENQFFKKTIGFAILRFSPLSGENPSINATERKDSVVIKYSITNFGTGNAFNINLNEFFLDRVNGKYIIQKKLFPSKANKSVVIYPSKTEGLVGFTYALLAETIRDSDYFCYKLDFTDSSKRKKSFMKIFHVDLIHLRFLEPEDSLYNDIESFLIKNKYWKPPFRQ